MLLVVLQLWAKRGQHFEGQGHDQTKHGQRKSEAYAPTTRRPVLSSVLLLSILHSRFVCTVVGIHIHSMYSCLIVIAANIF